MTKNEYRELQSQALEIWKDLNFQQQCELILEFKKLYPETRVNESTLVNYIALEIVALDNQPTFIEVA